MKQVILNIPDNKFNFFLELIRNLGLKVEKTIEPQNLNKEQEIFVHDMKNALKQVDDHIAGKAKLQNVIEFLDEV